MQDTVHVSSELPREGYAAAAFGGRSHAATGENSSDSKETLPVGQSSGRVASRAAVLRAAPAVNGSVCGKCPLSRRPRDHGLVARFACEAVASATVVVAERWPPGAGLYGTRMDTVFVVQHEVSRCFALRCS
jgi:hypothetical protein